MRLYLYSHGRCLKRWEDGGGGNLSVAGSGECALALHNRKEYKAEMNLNNLTAQEWMNLKIRCAHHIVHDYANLVSSAEMVLTGQHLRKGFDPPVNSHIFHAFLLNSRKIADFFGTSTNQDDILASHYVPAFVHSLPHCDAWRVPVNKQLAHLTYTRDHGAKEITNQADHDIYHELKQTWKDFQGKLQEPFGSKFRQEITNKLATEFQGLDLW
jgi:hypothetical protein